MSKPIHSYLDLDVVNNNLTTSSSPMLTFQDNRNSPFLEGDSSEYLCSIIRFSIQTGSSLPIFIPRIQTEPTQFDRNLTMYQINIQYTSPVNGNLYEQYVNLEYILSDAYAPVPAIPVVQQDLSSTYNYVYNASTIVDMLNTAIATAWGNLSQIMSATDLAVFSYVYQPMFINRRKIQCR